MSARKLDYEVVVQIRSAHAERIAIEGEIIRLEERIRTLRQLWHRIGARQLALRFGVSKTAVQEICRYRSYKAPRRTRTAHLTTGADEQLRRKTA